MQPIWLGFFEELVQTFLKFGHVERLTHRDQVLKSKPYSSINQCKFKLFSPYITEWAVMPFKFWWNRFLNRFSKLRAKIARYLYIKKSRNRFARTGANWRNSTTAYEFNDNTVNSWAGEDDSSKNKSATVVSAWLEAKYRSINQLMGFTQLFGTFSGYNANLLSVGLLVFFKL